MDTMHTYEALARAKHCKRICGFVDYTGGGGVYFRLVKKEVVATLEGMPDDSTIRATYSAMTNELWLA